MEVYVKESLHVLDYKNNIVDTIFLSNDNITAGYAYNITITEANTGYSDLKFEMPNMIIDNQGNKIHNPKLALLTPLVKLRYRREVYYTGTEPITVREPQGYGDEVVYIDKTYSNKYPDNLIEDYVMDYIVQPVDRKRNSLQISTQFTAIDYPRFNLSKKKVGLTIDKDTLTEDAWTLFENKPMSVPGTVQYIEWKDDLFDSLKNLGIPNTWNPETAEEYPLTKTQIEEIIKGLDKKESFPYGILGTCIYWQIKGTDRFEGRMYEKDGYLVLQLYDFYANTTEGIDPDKFAGRYSWEWTQLYKVQSYLTPNNARNYLYHILNGTNWSVGDVDIVKTDIPNPSGEGSSSADLTCSISINNSNCYNAITSVCKGLQLYPMFDCINNTVSLKVFAGKNYGLVYRLGSNLTSNQVKLDGEKVITKLYVSGGKDYNGDANINIGDATRSYVQYLTGMYTSTSQLPTKDVPGYWAIVDPALNINKYWVAGANRKIYFYINQQWVLGINNGDGTWSYGDYIVDAQTGTPAPWDPNDQSYVFTRSPYGANYILNYKWMYDNKWITKEEILQIYQYEKQIHDLNSAFIEDYTENLIQAKNAYNEAVNNYEIALDEYESTLHSMMNKYYKNDKAVSEGMRYCFHVAPKDTIKNGDKTYVRLKHCFDCGKSEGITSTGNSSTCTCGSTNIKVENIHIPIYSDWEDWKYSGSMYTYGTNDNGEGPAYDPHLKGYYQRLVSGLDRSDDTQQNVMTIKDYERLISIIKPVDYKAGGLQDGYNYVVTDEANSKSVYVRSVSGQLEVWNEAVVTYIKAWGQSIEYKKKMDACQARLKELQTEYDTWAQHKDDIYAEEQDRFGDYIVEGNYANDEQPYSNLLFREGMEASDKFCIPKITYNLDVIDSSGLIEYRTPQPTQYECTDCDYISYSPMTSCERCGSKSIWTMRDTYNDLVRMLHSVGQIVPKAGDYTTIYDEPMGMFGVPGLITEISRTLDNPVNNQIKLDTAYTDNEELVGNIITATNTVLNNSDIYARTAVINADGTIDSTSIKNSLDNPNANISIVGTAGSILLTGSGLRCTDPSDPSRAMKYAGNGVFKTTTLTESGEGTIWEKMMTPDGINATYINAGSIDTNKLTITSGLNGTVLIDQYGMTVKNNARTAAHHTNFNVDDAVKIDGYATDWSNNNNIATFIGVTKNRQPLMYTKGFLIADKGSKIAGWVVNTDENNNGLYHLKTGTKTGAKDLWLSPTGINGDDVLGNKDSQGKPIQKNYSLYVNGNFGVTPGGTLHAKGAIIEGSGKFTGDITANSLTLVAGGTMSGISYNNLENKPDLTVYLYKDGTVGHEPAEGATGFQVSSAGLLKASNAIIYGTIYASNGKFAGTIESQEGHIGGWLITKEMLQRATDNYSLEFRTDRADNEPAILVWDRKNLKYNFYVTTGGTLYARGVDIGGTISGSTISGSTLVSGNLKISNGAITCTNGGASIYFADRYLYLDASGFGNIELLADNIHMNTALLSGPTTIAASTIEAYEIFATEDANGFTLGGKTGEFWIMTGWTEAKDGYITFKGRNCTFTNGIITSIGKETTATTGKI